MGDDRADFERFCRDLSPRLLGALVLAVGNRSTAEDLTQEALARAWERWDRVQDMEHPDGWVFRVGFNLANSHHRRRRLGERARSLLGRRELVEMPGARIELAEALSMLTPRQREAVVLRHYLDLSVAEAAAAMGCAEGTVKALTSQGLNRLGPLLGDPNEEGP